MGDLHENNIKSQSNLKYKNRPKPKAEYGNAHKVASKTKTLSTNQLVTEFLFFKNFLIKPLV